METYFKTLEFHKIIELLKDCAATEEGKEKLAELKPYLSEQELRLALRDTTEARVLLDNLGNAPVPAMDGVYEMIESAVRGEMLNPEQLEKLAAALNSIRRFKDYLKRGKRLEVGLAYDEEQLDDLPEVREEIFKMIRNQAIDDQATDNLKRIRRDLILIEEKMKEKAESQLRIYKKYLAENFVVTRNNRICIPVKKEYKLKISGSVVDKSSSGSTYFIEPEVIRKLGDQLVELKIEEENEEMMILYTLSALAADHEEAFQKNREVVKKLDIIFAKGKLSLQMDAAAPEINTERKISIRKGKHPLLDKNSCVPLNFQMNLADGVQGIVITGPNTGGKTVSIKTVGLFCLMAQSGLHLPCEHADICMNDKVLCDIGDGQNITQNLSTFSSHITNVLSILRKVTKDSLVILDELGSGTDPQEGMGIAISILNELKESGCLFVVTTHYPEVKAYAEKQKCIRNARMAFDRESLKPLYQLEIGKSGESCALYIAGRLGMPEGMLKRAAVEAYGEKQASEMIESMPAVKELEKEKPSCSQQLHKIKKPKAVFHAQNKFHRGDCIMVYPERKLGIVAKEADNMGRLVVQLQKEKKVVNHTRLKLHVPAEELYPEDYDFSILFDSVAVRKARKKMSKSYQEDLEIRIE